MQLRVGVGQKGEPERWSCKGGARGRDLIQKGKGRGRGRQLGGVAHMQLMVGVGRDWRVGESLKREEPEAGSRVSARGVESMIEG